MNRIIVIATILILGFASGAQATLIDFSSDDFSSADGSSSYKYAGVTVEASPDNSLLYWSPTDGLGVHSDGDYENDEVQGKEILHLVFDTEQLLQSILITDLFNEVNSDTGEYYLETGSYSFDGITWYIFSADEDEHAGSSNGELTLSFSSSITINEMLFKAPGSLNDGSDHEFSVAGIDVAPVPEPATMLLFGTGLASLAGFRRKFRKA